MSKFLSSVVFVATLAGAAVADEGVTVVPQIPTTETNPYYVGNRPPLLPSPLLKLPIGAIEPGGWMRKQLELEAEGFTGHLAELSEFLKKEDNAWLSKTGEGSRGWEEVPYWLKGYGDLGYVLGDERIIKEARTWIEGALASQQASGYFGPQANLTRIDGKPDLWPHMIMLNALQSYYEYTGDERVIELMTRYFQWQMTVDDEDFLVPFWQHIRGGDNLASVYWLYNRTGEPWLLELAEKVHRCTAEWSQGVANWHGVNIGQGFREPATYYVQAKDPRFLDAAERNYQEVMGIYGQVPGGMFGADENCRPGYTGPRQAAETCTMVEFMLSFEMLLAITGDPLFADRCEEVAFNSLPASMTANLKGLRYLTSPNMVQADSQNKAPGIQNGGQMLSYNPHSYRCCQHNVAHGWPYYAEHLWMATPDRGLAAVLYAESNVTAKVGDGTEVTITEDTRYPFEAQIDLMVKSPQPVQFPLYLRVPGWCRSPQVKVNGEVVKVDAMPRSFIRIERTWRDGDRVELTLPMEIRLRTWAKNHDSVSVDRGPLTYSLLIGERYEQYAGTEKWPAFEVYPTTPWNYGLVIDEEHPTADFAVETRAWPENDQPFEPESVPVLLKARGRRIPQWQQDRLGLVGKLQPSPALTEKPVEDITLIPMGAARLRISAFPTVTTSEENGRRWVEPQSVEGTPTIASHVYASDSLAAMTDGLEPKSSGDQSIPRFTWWDRRGTTEWVEYTIDEPKELSRVAVYWFDDTPNGGCCPPAEWRLLYKDGDLWRQVAGPEDCGVETDQYNVVEFGPVETKALRIEARLREGFSAGILEWKVE